MIKDGKIQHFDWLILISWIYQRPKVLDKLKHLKDTQTIYTLSKECRDGEVGRREVSFF